MSTMTTGAPAQIGGGFGAAAVFFGIGWLFAVLQFSFFFTVEFHLSSAYTTYLTVTVAWLVGSVLGLAWRGGERYEVWLLLGGTAAYYLGAALLNAFQFQEWLMPIVTVLIVGSGLYAGLFFRARQHVMRAKWLFFWENNGFVTGIVTTFVAFTLIGRDFIWITPAVAALVMAPLIVWIRARHPAPSS